MIREKQIKEMAKVIEQARIKAADTTNSMNYGFGGWYAKELYTAGYRKASDVASEVIDDISNFLESRNGVGYVAIGIVELKRWLYELKKKYTQEK